MQVKIIKFDIEFIIRTKLIYIKPFRLSAELVEEIVVSNLLIKGLDILAEPDTINKLIIQIIKNHNEEKISKNIEHSSVQVLKHWCQMNGCIFKSVNFMIYFKC